MSNQLDHVQRSLHLKNNGKLMVALIGCIFLVRFVLIRRNHCFFFRVICLVSYNAFLRVLGQPFDFFRWCTV